MAKTLVPAEFKTHIIDQLLESITETSNTAYYAFIGDHETVASTIEEVNQPLENVKKTNPLVFRNMIYGKRLTASDIRFVVNRHDWVSGTIYAMYDDEVSELQDKNFYVVVDEDSFKHVYKCLSNNNGAASVYQPLFQDAKYDADLYTEGDDYYQTADGYQWKYLYTIDSTTFSKFASQKYIPIVANTTVQDNAVEGAIDVVKIDSAGKNYNNYVIGKFALNDFNRIGSNFGDYGFTAASTVYKLPSGSNQTTNYYQNTIIYLTSGTGAGQFKRIIRSIEIEALNGVFIELEENFTTLPDFTTTYEIYPEVAIIGDGNQSKDAVARAIVDRTNANHPILSVDILERGANYSYATAVIRKGTPATDNSGTPITVTDAIVRPILPPQGGHGANTAIELGAKRVSFYSKFNRNESGVVEPTNTFAQFGLMRDPQFANVEIYYTDEQGFFLEDEKVQQFTQLQIAGTFTSSTSLGATIEASVEQDFARDLKAGDKLLLKTATQQHIVNVVLGSNTSVITIDETPVFADSANVSCNAYYVEIQAEGTITNINPPAVNGAKAFLIDNVTPEFSKGSLIYGVNSKTIATIAGIDINNRISSEFADFTFDTFNQMLRIEGTITGGDFVEDETVTQGSSSAQLHSVSEISGSKKTLSLTNVVGKFRADTAIVGSVSGALCSPTATDTLDITPGDVDPNTGSIIYLQNDIPVDRSENQSEEIRVILEF